MAKVEANILNGKGPQMKVLDRRIALLSTFSAILLLTLMTYSPIKRKIKTILPALHIPLPWWARKDIRIYSGHSLSSHDTVPVVSLVESMAYRKSLTEVNLMADEARSEEPGPIPDDQDALDIALQLERLGELRTTLQNTTDVPDESIRQEALTRVDAVEQQLKEELADAMACEEILDDFATRLSGYLDVDDAAEYERRKVKVLQSMERVIRRQPAAATAHQASVSA